MMIKEQRQEASTLPLEEEVVGRLRTVSAVKSFLSLEGLRHHLQTPLYANAYYLMANTAVNSLSGFVFWMVAARFYTADDVGIASAMISAILLLSGLSSLGLGSGLIRFLPGAGAAAGEMLNSSLTLITLLSLLSAIVFLVGLPLWSPALTLMYGQPIFIMCFVLFTLLCTWSGVISLVFVAHRASRFTLLSSVVAGAKIFLLITFTTLYGAFGIFASIGVATGVSLVVALLWFLPAVQNGYFPRPRLCLRILRSLLPFSIGNYLVVFLYQTPQIILPIMVLNVLGARESAYIYTVWMIATMFFMISGAISASVFAEGSNEEKSVPDNVRRALSLTAMLSLPAVLIMLILGDRLLLFFGRDYLEGGGKLLTILVLSTFPVGINNIYFAVKKVTKEIGTMFVLSALIAGGTLGLSYLLMPRYGIAATGIGWMASQGMVTGFIACSALVKRINRNTCCVGSERSAG
jgi:O-antigen/teichoic acid export membrane protein